MAEKTVISIEVEGTGKAINSLKELKAELKAAQSAALNGDGKAAKRVVELKDKMDDLKDTTKSLQGSGVEKISSSFRLLGQGFKHFDTDKISTGFKGIGTAMKAIPIFLLIEGITYLIENWEELSKGNGLIAKSLQFLGSIFTGIIDVIYKFTDAIGLSNTALEKQGEAMVKANEKSQEALQATTANFDRQLAVAKAAGKSTIQIEKLKQQAIIDTNVEIAKGIEAHIRKNGEFTEDMKKQLSGSLEAIKNAKVKEYEITKEDDKNKKEKSKERLANNLEAIKKIEDAQIAAIKNEELRLISAEVKANERRIKEIKNGKESAELKRQELEAQAVLYEQNISKINADAAAKRKAEEDKIAADKKAEEEKIAADKKAEEEKRLKTLEDDKKKQLALEQRAADLQKQLEANKQRAVFEIAEKSLIATQALSDTFFAIKMANVKKGSKEEDDAARKQFKLNKALSIANIVMSGSQSVLAITAVPDFTLGIASAIRIGAIALTTAAQVAKISALQFQSNSDFTAPSLGEGASSSGAPSTSGTPSIAPPPQNTTTFTGNNNNNFNTPPVKTYVVETDLRSATDRMDRIKEQATF